MHPLLIVAIVILGVLLLGFLLWLYAITMPYALGGAWGLLFLTN